MAATSSAGASTSTTNPEDPSVNPDALSASDNAAKLSSMESQVNAQAPAATSSSPTPAVPPTPVNPTVPATPPSSTSSLNKSSPLYIGATNFANLQKSYSPAQISASTTKDTAGNIYWKQGANINAPITPTPFTAPPTPPPANTDDLSSSNGGTIDASTLTSDQTSNAVAASVAASVQKYNLPTIYSAIDDLEAQRDAQDKAAITATQTDEQNQVTKMQDLFSAGTTAEENAVTTANSQYNVDQNIQILGTVATQMQNVYNDMSSALDSQTGDIGTLAVMNGRTASIKNAAVAKINALKTIAATAQGDIDSAKAAADTQISIIEQNTTNQSNALNTLLDLDKTNLVTLTADEKDTVAARLANLKSVADAASAQVTAVADLITKFPSAAAAGGVSYNDTQATALAKMLPKMSANEQLTFNLTNAKTAEDTALEAKNLALAGKDSGTGGGTGTAAPAELADYTAQLAWASGNNVTAQQAIAKIEAASGKLLSAKAIAYIKSILAGNKTPKPSPADTPLTAAGVKSLGYDPVAHPDYVGKTPNEIAALNKTASPTPSQPGLFTKIKNFFVGS